MTGPEFRKAMEQKFGKTIEQLEVDLEAHRPMFVEDTIFFLQNRPELKTDYHMYLSLLVTEILEILTRAGQVHGLKQFNCEHFKKLGDACCTVLIDHPHNCLE